MAEIKARFPIVLVGFLLLTIVISACAPPITEASAMDPVDAQKEEQTTSIDEPKKAPESDKPEENDKKVESEGDEAVGKSEQEAEDASSELGDNADLDGSGGSEDDGVLNPLTGLPVENTEWLYKRPIMVAISNFPPSAIPHSGESFAAHVFELFQGYGMTRNLAIFFGDYADQIGEILENRLADGTVPDQVIGPIRSGRVVFEDVKKLYPHALLITAGASSGVKAQLSNRVSVYGSNPDDINSTGVGADQLGSLADYEVNPEDFVALKFDASPPGNGEPAPIFRMIYNLYNQIGWEYSPEAGAYLRSHDKADGTGELFPETDRLTGTQLAFENVIVLWAQHRYVTPTVVEMNLVYVTDQKGILFRNGVMVPIKWSSRSGVFKIHDAEGNPIPLKPGKSFFEVVSYETTWDPDKMIVRFHEPPKGN